MAVTDTDLQQQQAGSQEAPQQPPVPAPEPTPPSEPAARGGFVDAVAVEKGYAPLPPEYDLPSGRIRRLLFHGTALSPAEAAEQTGGSDRLLYATVAAMKEWGFEFETVPGPNGKRTRLLNARHVPTEKKARVPKKPAAKKATPPKVRSREVEPAAPPKAQVESTMSGALADPVPALDQALTVYLIFRDPETGDIKLGLRDGGSGESWLCAVEGHTAASFD